MAKRIKLYARNAFGVPIKRCCASCAFKSYTAAGERHCSYKDCKVESCKVCGLWKMNKQLKAAGLSGGKVKRKEYLSFLLTIRQEEQVARQNGLRIVSKSVEQIRVMFEREFGSIYHIG